MPFLQSLQSANRCRPLRKSAAPLGRWELNGQHAGGAAATTAAAAIATAEARFAGFGLVDLDISTLELSIVELLNCLGSVLRICHFDEAEAPRLTGKLVRDYSDALNLTCL